MSTISYVVFRPVLILGNNFGEKFGGISGFFTSKASLYKENDDLKSELMKDKAMMANYDSIVAENLSLKEILGRKNEKSPMVLATILAKPSQSPYDTLVVDAGIEQGIKAGDIVFALGNVPIGRVAEVYPHSSKVILFTTTGVRTQVAVSDKHVFMELVGRGGGNFEMVLPRDFKLAKGDQALLPGIDNYLVGIVETIISDPRDPFIKALLVSPVNIQELKFVQVETQK